ncbi:site-specific integrase, partial [Listeria monocytogenes]
MIQGGKLEQQFFDYLHSELNYSVNTSTAYENDLLDFRRFLNEQAITT